MVEAKDEKGNKVYKGYCVDLLEALGKLMKFEYEIYASPDGQYGRMTPDKKWNGVIKELVDRVKISVVNESSSTRFRFVGSVY